MTILEHTSGLNSGSHVSRKCNSSFIIPLTLLVLIKAKDNSTALLQVDFTVFVKVNVYLYNVQVYI